MLSAVTPTLLKCVDHDKILALAGSCPHRKFQYWTRFFELVLLFSSSNMLSAVILKYVGYDKWKGQRYLVLPDGNRCQKAKVVRQTSHCIFQASYATRATTPTPPLTHSTTGVFYFLYRYRFSGNLRLILQWHLNKALLSHCCDIFRNNGNCIQYSSYGMFQIIRKQAQFTVA